MGKDEDIKRYRKISKRVRDLTRRDHKEHLEDITNNSHNDQRAFWRWLKKTKQVATSIQNLIFQGRVVSSTIKKARVFKPYFSSTFTKENVDKLRHLKPQIPLAENSLTSLMLKIQVQVIVWYAMKSTRCMPAKCSRISLTTRWWKLPGATIFV